MYARNSARSLSIRPDKHPVEVYPSAPAQEPAKNSSLQSHKLFDKSWIAQPSKLEQIQVLPNFAVYNVLVEVLYGFKRNVVPELFVINLFASILCIILNWMDEPINAVIG